MIDWATVLVPIREPLDFGSVVFVGPGGEFQSECPRFHRVGSAADSVSVRNHYVEGSGWFLYIDGNPAKFFQKHNAFGTDDPAIIWRFGRVVRRLLGARARGGDWFLNRIDINRSFRVGGTDDLAAAWLRSAEAVATVKHRGRGVTQAGTWYIGKNSRRWSLKAYVKSVEMRARNLRRFVGVPIDKIIEWATGCVRIELVFRRMELQEKRLRALRHWTPEIVQSLYESYLERLNIPMNKPLEISNLSELPPWELGIYHRWLSGEHLPASMSRSAFYRARARLRAHGIDIGTDPLIAAGDVVPLLQVVAARPAVVPSELQRFAWAA